MYSLNKSLKRLEIIYKNEQIKKQKKYNLKVEKKEQTSGDGLVKMFLKQKQKHEYKNSLRLKSLRNQKVKVISEDFDNKYKQQQTNIFNQPWNKLPAQIKLNRVYSYMKIRKNELEWSLEEYEMKLEGVKDGLELNGLRKLIEYDIEEGEIKNCWMIDEKKEEE